MRRGGEGEGRRGGGKAEVLGRGEEIKKKSYINRKGKKIKEWETDG